jgi:RNA polymerase sigma factor (sigma-70 family)
MKKPRQPVEPDAGQPTPPDRLLGSVVGRIHAGESQAAEELYFLLYGGIRFFALRQVGPFDAEEVAQETFLITIEAIHRGAIRNHDAIAGFVLTIMRRQVIRVIRERKSARRELTDDHLVDVSDPRSDPERDALAGEKQALMMNALKAMSDRDREILTRFYLQEQTQEQICAEMCLTGTQFRLVKSRAKAKLAERGSALLKPTHSSQFARAAVV